MVKISFEDVICPYSNPCGYVYITVNTISNKYYIGQHTAKEGKKDNYYLGSGYILQKAIKKYGRSVFKNYVIEWADTQVKLDELEQKWISKFNAVNSEQFYNIRTGGRNGFTSEDIKLFWKLGLYKDISGNANPAKRQDVKEKLSKSTRDYANTHKEEMILRGEKHKKLWKEHRELFPQCNCGKDSPFYNRGKQVKCIEYSLCFPNAMRAGEWVKENYPKYPNASDGNIRDACKGKRKSAYGLHWEYVKVD